MLHVWKVVAGVQKVVPLYEIPIKVQNPWILKAQMLKMVHTMLIFL